VQSAEPVIDKLNSKFWPTKNLPAMESAKCRSQFHTLPLALLPSAYSLDSSYEVPYNFTWPVRHFPHSAMICPAHPFSGPTALAVVLGGCWNFPISLNVSLMSRLSLITAGLGRRSFYLRFLPAKVKIAIPTAAQ